MTWLCSMWINITGSGIACLLEVSCILSFFWLTHWCKLCQCKGQMVYQGNHLFLFHNLLSLEEKTVYSEILGEK